MRINMKMPSIYKDADAGISKNSEPNCMYRIILCCPAFLFKSPCETLRLTNLGLTNNENGKGKIGCI